MYNLLLRYTIFKYYVILISQPQISASWLLCFSKTFSVLVKHKTSTMEYLKFLHKKESAYSVFKTRLFFLHCDILNLKDHLHNFIAVHVGKKKSITCIYIFSFFLTIVSWEINYPMLILITYVTNSFLNKLKKSHQLTNNVLLLINMHFNLMYRFSWGYRILILPGLVLT